MAEQLVGMMTDEFDPAAYRDEYREALMGIIEAKAAGEEIAEPAAAAGREADGSRRRAGGERRRGQGGPRDGRAGDDGRGVGIAEVAQADTVGVPVMAEPAAAEVAPARRRKSA